jgi:hypothetical protein
LKAEVDEFIIGVGVLIIGVGGVWLCSKESIVIVLFFIGGCTIGGITVGRVLFISVTKSIVGELDVTGKDISAVTGDSV